jgi:hypothetical protein
MDTTLLTQHVLYIIPTVIKMALVRETAFFSGFFQAITLVPKILKSRLTEKMHWIKSNGEILQLFTKI